MARSVPAKERAQVRQDVPAVAHPVSPGPMRLTVICAAILAALIVATSAYFFSNLRDHVLTENRRQLENTASLLAQQIGHLFDAVRSVHAEVVTLVSSETPLHGEFLRQLTGYEVHLKLRDKIAGMPYVGSLALFDAQGDLVNFSTRWPLPSVNVADHQFFQTLKSDAGAVTF